MAKRPSFDSENNPKRAGLPPVGAPLAERPVAFRPFEEDEHQLAVMEDRSGFIRRVVHQALRDQAQD